jgi:DNA-binding transcriptional LysR family regulator
MGLTANALYRKIDEPERELGVVLVTRHVDGIRPTAEGAEILLATKTWRKPPSNSPRPGSRASSHERRSGSDRSVWNILAWPRLVEFQCAYPTSGLIRLAPCNPPTSFALRLMSLFS